MKILVGIPTCKANEEYFWAAEASLNRARTYMKEHVDAEIDLLVFDFTNEYYRPPSGPSWSRRLLLKNYGFPMNFNVARNIAITTDYDYLVFLNDDVVIHREFLDRATFILKENEDVGFAGGVSQQGGWNEDYVNVKVPEPTWDIEDLNSLSRLNWEFSAACFPIKALQEVGPMDGMFALRTGLCCDNDYLHRLRRIGYKTIRFGGMTFWHSKARSQSKLRNPFDVYDPHRLRAVQWMFLKWGVDIRMGGVSALAFTEPFNGEEMEVLNDNMVRIGNKIINLIEC